MTDLCFENDQALLTLTTALTKIRAAIKPITDTEWVSLPQALDRVLAEPLFSRINIPPFRNASMDGYAICFQDTDQEHAFNLQQVGTSWAGAPYSEPCQPGQCIRIFTGAYIPEGADCVIMQEQVSVDGKTISFSEPVTLGQNIRLAGEDVKQGELLLHENKKINAADLGLIASAGIYKIKVKRKLRIAFFSTGNELCALGDSLSPGQIYDSNRYTLKALLSNSCHSISDLGVLPDNPELIQTALINSSQHYDVIITTGGASVGDADYIQPILARIGRVEFWKIAIKPGKPLAFGEINGSYFFGLPGNPVSVIATFQQIVTPALKALLGLENEHPLQISAICMDHLKKFPGRQEFQRGILIQNPDGSFQVRSAGKQGSNILSAISQANCYIVLSADSSGVAPGEKVSVQPFSTSLSLV